MQVQKSSIKFNKVQNSQQQKRDENLFDGESIHHVHPLGTFVICVLGWLG